MWRYLNYNYYASELNPKLRKENEEEFVDQLLCECTRKKEMKSKKETSVNLID